MAHPRGVSAKRTPRRSRRTCQARRRRALPASASQIVAPVDMSQRHVPSPPASSARPRSRGQTGGLLLEESPILDVFGRADDPHHFAVCISNRTGHDEGVHGVTVASLRRDVAVPRFAPDDRREDRLGPLALLLRDHNFDDPPTEDLGFSPAVEFLREPVPQHDSPVARRHRDRARQRVDDCSLAEVQGRTSSIHGLSISCAHDIPRSPRRQYIRFKQAPLLEFKGIRPGPRACALIHRRTSIRTVVPSGSERSCTRSQS